MNSQTDILTHVTDTISGGNPPGCCSRRFSGRIILILLSLSVIAGAQELKSSAFHDGEWLRYKVKWNFIRLGTIEVFQEQVQHPNGPAYRIRMHAKSAKLPFIKVFFVNEGILIPHRPTLQHFTITVGKKADYVTTYTSHPASQTVLMKKVCDDQIVRIDSLFYSGDLYDAMGTFMMMRCLSESGFDGVLNNIIDFKVSKTHLKFAGEVDNIKVSAFDEAQAAWRFSGRADWVGKAYAGVSGPFKGWISQDTSALFLKVKVKIFLGSITLELEDYRRESRRTKSQLSTIATQKAEANIK